MTALQFWRLKARTMDLQNRRAQFEELLATKQREMLLEAGLDPTKVYRLDDEKLTATEITKD